MSTIPTEELQAIASFLLSNNLKTVKDLQNVISQYELLKEKTIERKASINDYVKSYYQRNREKVIAQKMEYYYRKKKERAAAAA